MLRHRVDMSLTSNSEGDISSDLPLEPVGGQACVVARIIASHLTEAQHTIALLNMRRKLTAICRGRQKEENRQGFLMSSEMQHVSCIVCKCVRSRLSIEMPRAVLSHVHVHMLCLIYIICLCLCI